MGRPTKPKRTYKHSDERRREIILTARDLIEEHGLSHVSIKDVSEATGVSRGALYYYFEDKNALVKAIIEDYIEDLAEAVGHWEETDTANGSRATIRSGIELTRRLINEKSHLRKNLTETENAGLYARFSAAAIERLVEKLDESTRAKFGLKPEQDDYSDEKFYVLIAGLIRYMRAYPEADTDMLTEVAASMLQIPLDA